MLPNRSLERCVLLLSNPYRVFRWSVTYSYFYCSTSSDCVCSKKLSPPPQTVRIVSTVMGHCHVLRLHFPPTSPGRTRRLREQPPAEASSLRSQASFSTTMPTAAHPQCPFLSAVEHCVHPRRHRSLAFTFPFGFLMAVPLFCPCVGGFPSFCLYPLRPP